MVDHAPQRFPFVSAAPLPVLRPPHLPRPRMPFWVLVLYCAGVVLWIAGSGAELVAAAVAACALLVLWLGASPRAPVPSSVRAGAEGLEIDGKLVPRARIRDAFLLRDPLRVYVRKRSGVTAEVHVGSVKEGRALLRALGLDVSQTVVEFRTGAPSKWRHVGDALGYLRGDRCGVGRSPSDSHAPYEVDIAAGMVMLLGLALLTLSRAKLRVGVEGIQIRWLWTRRFLRYDGIEIVERFQPFPRNAYESAALRIVLSSGEELRVPGNARTLELLEARILEARRRSRKGDAGAVTPLLRRGDRSVGAWIGALRSLGAGANAGPRTAPVPRESLFRVVEDPSLPARDRAAAAVALGIDLDDEDRARLRTAAGSTAMPRLRVAIEAAASGAEEAEVEAALAEIDEGEAASHRARR